MVVARQNTIAKLDFKTNTFDNFTQIRGEEHLCNNPAGGGGQAGHNCQARKGRRLPGLRMATLQGIKEHTLAVTSYMVHEPFLLYFTLDLTFKSGI